MRSGCACDRDAARRGREGAAAKGAEDRRGLTQPAREASGAQRCRPWPKLGDTGPAPAARPPPAPCRSGNLGSHRPASAGLRVGLGISPNWSTSTPSSSGRLSSLSSMQSTGQFSAIEKISFRALAPDGTPDLRPEPHTRPLPSDPERARVFCAARWPCISMLLDPQPRRRPSR